MIRRGLVVAGILASVSLAALCAAGKGGDFIGEARLIYAVLACGEAPLKGGCRRVDFDRDVTKSTLPAGLDAAAVAEHCREVRRGGFACALDFAGKAGPFLARLRPAGLPRRVVYPFGGSDLFTALVTFPEATEFTTISLESAGDPRRLEKAASPELRRALAEFRRMFIYHMCTHDSTNANVRASDRGIFPGQLAFSLAAAAVFGYEPVSLRFFRIEPDGALHYLDRDEIASMENVKAKKLSAAWYDTDFSVAFRNMEVAYMRRDPGERPEKIVHRHIAANLNNVNFAGSLLKKHLEGKGRIAAMTKAGSYLLWFNDFSALRDYLLARMDFMVSDSTGILPRHALAAGFEQITYGKFYGAFLDDDGGADAATLRRLWESQPYRPLPFRYGYSDVRGASHLLITRPMRAREK
jgi:hypothetical protein